MTCVTKTSDRGTDNLFPNLLFRAPFPEKPNQVWAGDITFIPTAKCWLYLAVVKVPGNGCIL